MKIAVTYENGQVFQHFGHTAQFKLYEVENGAVTSAQVVDTNGSGHGALAGLLAQQGAAGCTPAAPAMPTSASPSFWAVRCNLPKQPPATITTARAIPAATTAAVNMTTPADTAAERFVRSRRLLREAGVFLRIGPGFPTHTG